MSSCCILCVRLWCGHLGKLADCMKTIIKKKNKAVIAKESQELGCMKQSHNYLQNNIL